MSRAKKGFTLLELLIVIGILAILATATVVVLNPGELLRQSRDAQRISDMAVLNKALGLYVTSATSSDLNAVMPNTGCASPGGRTYQSGTTAATSTFSAGRGGGGSGSSSSTSASSARLANGNGWLPVDFTAIPGRAPFAKLPIDPSNDVPGWLVYQYACDQTTLTYELNTKFESSKFNTTDNRPGKDGGNDVNTYEVGTAGNLAL